MEVNGLNNINKASATTSAPSLPQSQVTSNVSTDTPVVESAPTVVSEPTKEVNMTTAEQSGSGIRPHVREVFNEEVEKQLKDMIQEINSRMQSHTEISYSIHEKSSKLSIKIVDKESKKVLKEWPSEKSLDLLAKIFEQQAVMLDKKL